MKNFNKLMEMDITDVIKNIAAPQLPGCAAGGNPVIQPDSNVGEFGQNQASPSVESFRISQTEDGCIKISTESMCFKMKPAVIEALKLFLNELEDNDNNDEGEENNGTLCRK